MPRQLLSRKSFRLSGVMLTVGGAVLAVASPAYASGPTSFAPGDLVVYETLGTSSASQPVDLVDYSVSSTPVTTTATATPGFSVALPTADNGSTDTHALTESGSALNDGELTLSADGQNLIATGYDAAPGVTKITSALSTPRTVAVVSQTGVVDTSTSLTDLQTEGGNQTPPAANNFRSATQAVAGGNIYTGGDGGLGVTTDGSSSDSYLNTADTVHEVQVLNGNLYDSTTSGINEIGGGGLPTSGSPADTPLITGANLPAKFDPDQFAFVNLGSGPGPDTLYVADGAGGSKSGGDNLVEKFSLESGVWTATGTITVDQVVGLVADVTTTAGGQKVANIFVTNATSTSAGNNTVLSGFTDTSGYEGTLSGSFTQLATAPTGDDFKGLAFAPETSLPNNGDTPEVPVALLLPIAGGAVLAGGAFVTYRRRHHLAAPSIAQ